MTVKVDIVKEREGLAARVKELQQLCIDEWLIMSHQVAVQRNAELLAKMTRIQMIDRLLARRKRKAAAK